MSRRLQRLPYYPDTARLFAPLSSRDWSIFLDSSAHDSVAGRYDIVVSDPTMTLVTRGDTTQMVSRDGVRSSHADPFGLLRELLGDHQERWNTLPFSGGALGYFGYDLGRRIEQLPSHAVDDEKLPEMAVGIYDWALVVDHHRRETHLVSAGRDNMTAQRWDEWVELFSSPPDVAESMAFEVHGEIRSNLDFESYAEGFGRIQDYIREGDCYQVNFAQRFDVDFSGEPWAAYCRFRAINPAPFSAFLRLPFVQILSASPERFVQVRDRQVMTQPIKGTAPRSNDPQKDLMASKALQRSLKDRAENLMIVDLLRNDLSKSCALGSVKVPSLFELQSFATVHHLVSTITATLDNDRHALDLLRGCFPGGSITGAPKIRSMEIIEELEPQRRGVYCGSIGYIGFDGGMDTNIAIRTLTAHDGVMRYWAGGGIVADSTFESEYGESLDKAKSLYELVDVLTKNKKAKGNGEP